VNFSALDVNESPIRLRLSSTVVSVRHDGDPQKSDTVSIVYAKQGKLFRVRARSAVMAGGSWTTKHIVRDLPEEHRTAYAQFYRSPSMMVNVAVRNWRFLYKMGITGCRWFDGVGNYMDVRKMAKCGTGSATIGPDSPVVLSVKVLYSYPGESTEAQGIRGRGELLNTSFREYEERLRQQFTDMFSGSGFDARRVIAGIILNPWATLTLARNRGFSLVKTASRHRVKFCAVLRSGELRLLIPTWLARWTIDIQFLRRSGPWGNFLTRCLPADGG
jgi:spermidine dehydrogenase